jgi:hypothetical protein
MPLALDTETPEVAEARKALRCLYLEVPAPIASDVQHKVEAAFESLERA